MMKEWQRTVESCSIIYMMATPEVSIPIMIDAVNFVDLLELTTKHDGIFQPIPLTKELIDRTYFELKDKKGSVYFLNNSPYLGKAEIKKTANENIFELVILGKPHFIYDPPLSFQVRWFHDLQYYMRKHLCADTNWYRQAKVFGVGAVRNYNVTL